MNKIEFNTQICTNKEQSKRLLELDLNPNTADMSWTLAPISSEYPHASLIPYSKTMNRLTYNILPAWSLHRLIAMLPDFFSNLGRLFNLKMDKCFLRYCTARNDEYIYFQQKDTMYDNIIDCIEWLIKENKFNKEYLKEE